MRSAEDDVADRSGLVVDVANSSVQARVVERSGAEEPDLLLRREEQLDARVRPAFGEDAAGCIEHHRNG